MTYRIAYLLTTNQTSPRTQFSKGVLEKIGFTVKMIMALPHSNKVLSNKISMQYIYNTIAYGVDDWSYVFEDDINTLADITLDEITKYEKISTDVFYLGLCKYGQNTVKPSGHTIGGYPVMTISGYVRGLHAIALSKAGAKQLLELSSTLCDHMEYMDMILEIFTLKHPANIIRYDLESYIRGHRGIIFQDRNRFPSTI